MSRGDSEPICWKCGASNTPGSSECWLCQRTDWNRYPSRSRRSQPTRHRQTIGGWMVGIALLAGGIALFREAPGLGLFLIVLIVPAMAFTEAKARERARRGDPMPMFERVARVAALMFIIPVVVVLALAIALFTFCLFIGAFR